jgi:putative SOS response-associated peptidase YedK
MCGRYVAASQPDQIARYFGAEAPEVQLPPNYNVAPTNDVYAVVERADHTRHLETFHWGLVPSWATEVGIGSKMINARSETVATKSAFRSSLRKHRCIVPMDGFYEWRAPAEGAPLGPRGKPVKQPFYIRRADGEPLAVAGLWATWRDRNAGDDAPWLHSCTILTTDANELMATVHDRMPVILPASAWDAWLDPDNHDVEGLTGVLAPAAAGLLVMHAVSTDVNSVRNKGAELIRPLG